MKVMLNGGYDPMYSTEGLLGDCVRVDVAPMETKLLRRAQFGRKHG